MKLTFLGTGTSHGVPVIACNCKVCTSSDPKDKRYRSAAFITTNDGKNILIDIGPEFRIQAIENKITKLDAVLLTHEHADHLHGIDDLRIFSCVMSNKPENPNNKKYCAPPMPIYTNTNAAEHIRNSFPYLFRQVSEGGGHAKIELIEVSKNFNIGSLEITPIPMMHGSLPTTGWLFTETADNGTKQSIAYLTDCNFISKDSIKLIQNKCGILKHLIIDGLRIKEHSTHFNFLQALKAAEEIGGEHVWITHLTHNSSHAETEEYLQNHLVEFPKLQNAKSVLPAFDKLTLEI